MRDEPRKQESRGTFRLLLSLFDKGYKYKLSHQQRKNYIHYSLDHVIFGGSQVKQMKWWIKPKGLRADVDDVPGIIIKLILRLKVYG